MRNYSTEEMTRNFSWRTTRHVHIGDDNGWVHFQDFDHKVIKMHSNNIFHGMIWVSNRELPNFAVANVNAVQEDVFPLICGEAFRIPKGWSEFYYYVDNPDGDNISVIFLMSDFPYAFEGDKREMMPGTYGAYHVPLNGPQTVLAASASIILAANPNRLGWAFTVVAGQTPVHLSSGANYFGEGPYNAGQRASLGWDGAQAPLHLRAVGANSQVNVSSWTRRR